MPDLDQRIVIICESFAKVTLAQSFEVLLQKELTSRQLEVTIGWAWSIFFPPNIVSSACNTRIPRRGQSEQRWHARNEGNYEY